MLVKHSLHQRPKVGLGEDGMLQPVCGAGLCPPPRGFASHGRSKPRVHSFSKRRGLGSEGHFSARKEESAQTASLVAPLPMRQSVELCCREAMGRTLEGCGTKGGKGAIQTRKRERSEWVSQLEPSLQAGEASWTQDGNHSHSVPSSSSELPDDVHSSPEAVAWAEEGQGCAGWVRGSEDTLALFKDEITNHEEEGFSLFCDVQRERSKTRLLDGHGGETHFGSLCDSSSDKAEWSKGGTFCLRLRVPEPSAVTLWAKFLEVLKRLVPTSDCLVGLPGELFLKNTDFWPPPLEIMLQ